MERLERVVEAGGVLLKVERGNGNEQVAANVLLTFDVGRLLVEADAAAGRVHTVVIEGKEETPPGLTNASEDDPWWRILGSPLARVSAGDVGALGLRLQFRADTDNPRVVVIKPSGSDVEVSLDAMHRNS